MFRSKGSRFILLVIPLLLSLLLGSIAYAHSNANAPSSQDAGVKEQIDLLIASYERALEEELQNGETEVILDPIDGAETLLAGASAVKMDALWQDTLGQINALLARPLAERADAIAAVKSVEDTGVTYVEKTGTPYNKGATLEVYQTEELVYFVDIATNQIIKRFILDDWAYSVEPIYSQDELETMAREFVAQIGGVDLAELNPKFDNKLGETFFFRWEDLSRRLDGNIHPFVQVGLSRAGDFLNYVNTMPLVAQASNPIQDMDLGPLTPASIIYPHLSSFLGLNKIGFATYFNEVYANGGNYWHRVYGSMTTQSNAGYCYIAGWCSPKHFYYKNTCYGCSSAKGRWEPNTNPTVRPYAFIPNTHATHLQACYQNYYGSTMQERCRNQAIFDNDWIFTSYNSLYNIKKIDLSNLSDSIVTKEVAWDETWLWSQY
jgi:hypothetical protein